MLSHSCFGLPFCTNDVKHLFMCLLPFIYLPWRHVYSDSFVEQFLNICNPQNNFKKCVSWFLSSSWSKWDTKRLRHLLNLHAAVNATGIWMILACEPMLFQDFQFVSWYSKVNTPVQWLLSWIKYSGLGSSPDSVLYPSYLRISKEYFKLDDLCVIQLAY